MAGATRSTGGSNGATWARCEPDERAPGGCSSGRSSCATARPVSTPAMRGGADGIGDARRPASPEIRPSRTCGRGAPVPDGPRTTDAAPPPPVDDAAPVSSSWSQLVVLGHGGSALCLAQTSPDSVRLTDAQCVVETRLSHRTCGADGFGLLFSSQLLALALEVRRWEEDDSLRTAACRSNLPVFLDALCTHRHTPLPRRTIPPGTYPKQGKVPGLTEVRVPTMSQVSTLVNAG